MGVYGKILHLLSNPVVSPHILGQRYTANDIINADIWKIIHPKFSEFRMKVEHFSYIITNEKSQERATDRTYTTFFK